MNKRSPLADASPVPTAEEKEFVPGALVSYYDCGTRYGNIVDTEVDDYGALQCHIRPIGIKGKVLRMVTYPTTQLKLWRDDKK